MPNRPILLEPGAELRAKLFSAIVRKIGGRFAATLDRAVKKTGKTDGNRKFVHSNLPARDYMLEAKGIAKNRFRSGNADVTVPEPPKQLAAFTIAL